MQTPDGYVAIEEIVEGDVVFAYDEESGELVRKKVVTDYYNASDTIVDLVLLQDDGTTSTLHATPEHPFFVPAIGDYVAVSQLTDGIILLTSDDRSVIVQSLSVRQGEFDIYNFQVEGAHNYFVAASTGDSAVLVHNQSWAPLTGPAATKAANGLGYQKTNYRSHGRPVFTNGKNYISPDVDGHTGGVWKMAKTPEGLNKKSTRLGTYDSQLNRIGD